MGARATIGYAWMFIGRHLDKGSQPGGLTADDADKTRQADGEHLADNGHRHGVHDIGEVAAVFLLEGRPDFGRSGNDVVGKAQGVLDTQQQGHAQAVYDEKLVDPSMQHS